MNKPSHKHVLVLTHGQEDGGARATLAFALAVSLQAMGCDVAIYLNFQAAVWAFPNFSQTIEIKGFDKLQTYINLFQEAGGKLYVCSSCFENIPGWSAEQPNNSGYGPLRQGIIPAGVTTLASLLIDRKPLTF